MTLEDVVHRVERERGLPQDSSWRYNRSNGYRYLPWSGLWLHETGLLYRLNTILAADGVQISEVYEDRTSERPDISVGFDSEGDGIAPFPPDDWRDPDVLKGFWRYQEFRQPTVPLDFHLGPKQFHE